MKLYPSRNFTQHSVSSSKASRDIFEAALLLAPIGGSLSPDGKLSRSWIFAENYHLLKYPYLYRWPKPDDIWCLIGNDDKGEGSFSVRYVCPVEEMRYCSVAEIGTAMNLSTSSSPLSSSVSLVPSSVLLSWGRQTGCSWLLAWLSMPRSMLAWALTMSLTPWEPIRDRDLELARPGTGGSGGPHRSVLGWDTRKVSQVWSPRRFSIN